MATSRPFAYNTGSTLPDSTQVGPIAIFTGTSFNTSSGYYNNVKWYMGPDEDLGFVIAHPVPSNTQHTPIPGTFASLGFNRTKDFTDASFINLAQYVSNKYSTPQTFSSATQASTWLTTNGFWNTYISLGNRIMYWDVQNPTSYSAAGVTTIYDLDSNSNGTLYNGVSYWTGITNYLLTDYTSSSSYMMSNTSLNPVLNPSNTGSDISIFTWVYPLNNNGVIISEQGTPNPPDQNWFDSQIELVYGDLYFRVWPFSPVLASSTLPFGDWSYVGFTYTSGGTLTGYVNGIQVATANGSRQVPGQFGSGLFYDVGGYTTTNMGSGTGFDGRFGALEVYNYGLTSGQVLTNYNNTKINYTRGLIMDLDATNNSSYNGSGSVWYDITSLGNNGSISNAVYSAITGGTFYFNGTNAKVDVYSPLSSGTDYSISAWIYATDLTGSRNILSSENSPFWIASGTLYAGIGGNYQAVAYGPMQTNTWYMVSMSFNDSTNTMKLYVNGSLVDTNTNVTQTYTSESMYVGAHFYGGVNTSFFQGYISQVYLYDNEQTGPEVLHLYNRTKGTYQTQFTITSSDFVNYNNGSYITPNSNMGFVTTNSNTGPGQAFYNPILNVDFGGNLIKLNEIRAYWSNNSLSNLLTTTPVTGAFLYDSSICICLEINGGCNTKYSFVFEIKFFLNSFARKIAGHVSDKNWTLLIGERNSGKSLWQDFLQNCFGKYIIQTNSSNFEKKTFKSSDPAKELHWQNDFEFSRIIFSSSRRMCIIQLVRLKYPRVYCYHRQEFFSH